MPCSLSYLFTLVLLSSPNNEGAKHKAPFYTVKVRKSCKYSGKPTKRHDSLYPEVQQSGLLLCMGNPCVGQKVAGPWGRVTAVFFGPQGFQAALPIFWLLFQSPIATLVTHRPQESSVLIYINHST